MEPKNNKGSKWIKPTKGIFVLRK